MTGDRAGFGPATYGDRLASVFNLYDGVLDAPATVKRPADLDRMARLAGLRPRERRGGWNREPFTAASGRHVTVYARA